MLNITPVMNLLPRLVLIIGFIVLGLINLYYGHVPWMKGMQHRVLPPNATLYAPTERTTPAGTTPILDANQREVGRAEVYLLNEYLYRKPMELADLNLGVMAITVLLWLVLEGVIGKLSSMLRR